MLFVFYVIFVLINSIHCQNVFEREANPRLCNFFDTINITDGYHNPYDDSVTFDGIRFAKKNYATFTYTYSANDEKISVPAHIRGCICKYKNCVRLCCPYGHSFAQIKIGNYFGHKCELNTSVHEIILEGYPDMAFVRGIPCPTGFLLDPAERLHQWKILYNGSLLISENEDPLLKDRNGYCLANIFNKTSNEFNVRVKQCDKSGPQQGTPVIVAIIIYPAVMLVSVIFYILIIFVYIWIDELRQTIHGKTLICYLATLSIGYTLLATIRISSMHASNEPTECLIFAELIHTSFIGGFIWLGIISYDIWRTVGLAENHQHQFVVYCIFAFATTFIIVLITNLLDHVNLLEPKFRPGLGTTVCWLQETEYAGFLYLYLIIIIVLTINTGFFISTNFKIKATTDCVNNSKESRKFSGKETDTDRFLLFLRLFLIMGLPWFIEIVSWMTDAVNIVIYVMDIITMLQGPCIFWLFVKKPRVIQLIKQKWLAIRWNRL